MKIETSRLILREFEEADFRRYYEITSDAEAVRFVPWGPFSEDEARAKLEHYAVMRGEDPRREYQLAACDKSGGELVGYGVLYRDGWLSEAMIGWVIHKSYWRKGYATEIAAALIRLGFEELNLHRIYAVCDDKNTGSYRVMEKNGMRREGHHIKNSRIRGEWRNEYQYALLAEEYSYV